MHVEQMDTGHWWIGVHTADGRLVHLNFHARRKITLTVEDQCPDDLFATALGAQRAAGDARAEAAEYVLKLAQEEAATLRQAKDYWEDRAETAYAAGAAAMNEEIAAYFERVGKWTDAAAVRLRAQPVAPPEGPR